MRPNQNSANARWPNADGEAAPGEVKVGKSLPGDVGWHAYLARIAYLHRRISWTLAPAHVTCMRSPEAFSVTGTSPFAEQCT